MKRWISIAIAGLVFGAAATHAAQVGLIKINGATDMHKLIRYLPEGN